MEVKFKKNLLIVVFLLLLSFGGGLWLGWNAKDLLKDFPRVRIDRSAHSEKNVVDFDLFWKVWDTVHSRYYDREKIIDSNLVYGAIKGMVAAIGDPYTAFLPPEENKIVQEDLKGSFEGVGIQIGFKGNQMVVISPLPGSPAEKKGVKAGDLIIAIKDDEKGINKPTSGMTLQEAVQAIRGPSGSVVTLTLRQEGKDKPVVVDIVREKINIPSVTIDFIGEKVVHIKLLKFSQETLSEWEDRIVNILTRKEVDSIVLDLRNNPGGYLEDAVEIASDFLNTGDVVVVEEGAAGFRKEYKSEKIGRLKNYKLVVLVNEGSASASEILASALRDNKNVKIVGEKTFGKGTIQDPIQLNNGSGLHITIARWITPKGFWVNEKGITPDFEIKDDEGTEKDEQLEKAVEILSG